MAFSAKHILLTFLLSFGFSAANAQGVVVYKKDGTFVTFPYEQLDRIDTYNAGEEPGAGGGSTEPVNKSFTVEGVTFTMVAVQAGTLQMGSTKGDDDERPVHSVTISKDYYIGETEVTQALWKAVTGNSPTKDGSPWQTSLGKGADYPAYYINYKDVQAFVAELNRMTGETFRMPTEAEWEYAARGGNKSQGYAYSGSNTVGEVAWYEANSGNKMHPVKNKQANELGIYDMSGNVLEWCADAYSDSYYSFSPAVDPTGANAGTSFVQRGGCYYYPATNCRNADRSYSSQTHRYGHFGFRLAMSAK